MIANDTIIHHTLNEVNVSNNRQTSVWSAIKGPDMNNVKQFKRDKPMT